jgi:hypothetical protein
MGPEVAGIIGAFPFACVGERLAGVAGGEPVHPGHPGPVDCGDIAEVRCCGVVVGEDFGGVTVGVGVPQDPAAQDGP